MLCSNCSAHIRQDGTDCCHRQFIKQNPGEIQGCLNSTTRGYTMPAFTFEKISPPVRRGPIPPIVQKQRGVIVQILDRFVEARVKRSLRAEKGVIARTKQKPPKQVSPRAAHQQGAPPFKPKLPSQYYAAPALLSDHPRARTRL